MREGPRTAAAGSREPRCLPSLFAPCGGGLSGGRQEQGPPPSATATDLKPRNAWSSRVSLRWARPRAGRDTAGSAPAASARGRPGGANVPRRPVGAGHPAGRAGACGPDAASHSPLTPPAARRAVPGRRTQHTPGHRPPPEARPALPAVGGGCGREPRAAAALAGRRSPGPLSGPKAGRRAGHVGTARGQREV